MEHETEQHRVIHSSRRLESRELAVHELGARRQHAADGATGWAQVEAACAEYLRACAEPDVATIFLKDAPRVIPPAKYADIDSATNEPVVLNLLRRWVDEGLIEPVAVDIVGRLLGAALAEAGVLIAASAEPEATQRSIAGIIQGWLAALRRNVG